MQMWRGFRLLPQVSYDIKRSIMYVPGCMWNYDCLRQSASGAQSMLVFASVDAKQTFAGCPVPLKIEGIGELKCACALCFNRETKTLKFSRE